MALSRCVFARMMIAGLGLTLLLNRPGGSQTSPTAMPLSLTAAKTTIGLDRLLAQDESVWSSAPKLDVHLNRTPPLFDTDPMDDGSRPDARMQLLRTDTLLLVRLVWDDPTSDSIPPAPKYADAGEPSVYKRHSETIDKFRDAACLMTPRHVAATTNPSLVMGVPDNPVTLYYWRNGIGFAMGSAAGRGSTTISSVAFPGRALRTKSGWSVVFAIKDREESLPLAIAIWDGARQQRDGLKFYSLWYRVQ